MAEFGARKNLYNIVRSVLARDKPNQAMLDAATSALDRIEKCANAETSNKEFRVEGSVTSFFDNPEILRSMRERSFNLDWLRSIAATIGVAWNEEQRANCFRALSQAITAIETLRTERDLAIAHDRQPYPTTAAYEAVCKTRGKWQSYAEGAAAERDTLKAANAELVKALKTLDTTIVNALDGQRYGTLTSLTGASQVYATEGLQESEIALAKQESTS